MKPTRVRPESVRDVHANTFSRYSTDGKTLEEELREIEIEQGLREPEKPMNWWPKND